MVNSNLPLQLSPVIFVGNAVPGLDLLHRLHECYAALSLGPAPTHVTRGLLDVESADAVKSTLPAASVGPLQRAADNLQATFQASWAPALGTVTNTEVSVLTAPQHNFERGTVVLTRTTDQITEQYVLPFVRVDLGAGKHEIVGLDEVVPVAPNGRQRAAQITPVKESGISVTKTIVGAVLAETPFLPPPFGAAATGLLTVLNLILDSASPTPTNPFADLKADLKAYIDNSDLVALGISPISTVYTEINLEVDKLQKSDSSGSLNSQHVDLEIPIDKLTTLPAPLLHLWKRIDGTQAEYQKGGPTPDYFSGHLWDMNQAAAGWLWDHLTTETDDTNYADTLDVLIHAVTQQLMLAKLSIQCRALACSIHQREGNASAFDAQNQQWRAEIAAIADAIGDDPTTGKGADAWKAWFDSLTDDEIKEALDTCDPWIPRIRLWWASMRKKRLGTGVLSDLFRQNEPVPDRAVPGSYSNPQHMYVGTWTWTDKRDAASKDFFQQSDLGAWNNRTTDTDGPGCTTVERKDVAAKAREAYVAKARSDLDAAGKPHLDVLDGWATLVGTFYEMLPPDAPSGALTVTAPTGGKPSTASGTWSKDNVVRYQVAPVNDDHGPGPAGDWSPDYHVADLLGAVITGLPSPDGADSLWLYRQVRTATQKWDNADDAAIVAVIPRVGTSMPTTYTDTSD